MTINERVKAVRKSKEVNLTLEKFGERLGIKKSTLSAIETGRNALTEQNIRSICREFNVNEDWLRTGEGGNGNMYIKATPYQIAYNRFGYIMENATPEKKAALTMLLELLYTVPDDTWDTIMKEFEAVKKED